jgi:hypothetical protein
MPGKYKKLIDSYCKSRGIQIPVGFGRNTAQRYAVIKLDPDPPKLVARTWFNMEDVVYFLRNTADGCPVRILDFKEGLELIDEGGKRLKHGRPLDQT